MVWRIIKTFLITVSRKTVWRVKFFLQSPEYAPPLPYVTLEETNDVNIDIYVISWNVVRGKGDNFLTIKITYLLTIFQDYNLERDKLKKKVKKTIICIICGKDFFMQILLISNLKAKIVEWNSINFDFKMTKPKIFLLYIISAYNDSYYSYYYEFSTLGTEAHAW